MAATEEEAASDIHKDPNFAVICSFIERYGEILGLPDVSFIELQKYIEDTRSVSRNLQEVLLKLLRRWKGSISADKWQKHLAKFAFSYSDVDGWELEKFGFQRCKLSTKLRIIKNLLEIQFDTNAKFKEKINDKPVQDLRFSPLGRDQNGLAYWYLLDKDFNMRVYREEQDDVEAETWEMVVSDRNTLVELIGKLVQDQSKSRSATPSSQDGDISQDGFVALKVVTKEESEDVKPGIKQERLVETKPSEELKKEPADDGSIEQDIKQEPDVKEENVVTVKEEPGCVTGPDIKIKLEPDEEIEKKGKSVSKKVDGKEDLEKSDAASSDVESRKKEVESGSDALTKAAEEKLAGEEEESESDQCETVSVSQDCMKESEKCVESKVDSGAKKTNKAHVQKEEEGKEIGTQEDSHECPSGRDVTECERKENEKEDEVFKNGKYKKMKQTDPCIKREQQESKDEDNVVAESKKDKMNIKQTESRKSPEDGANSKKVPVLVLKKRRGRLPDDKTVEKDTNADIARSKKKKVPTATLR